MMKNSSEITVIKEHLQSARLILLYNSGKQNEAFRIAKTSNPHLAAAFLTEAAEPLRSGLTPHSQMRRAKLLNQAADILRLSDTTISPEILDAIEWLTAEISESKQREENLRHFYLKLTYFSISLFLAGITLLLFYA
jgi:hypothetical protein